MQSSALRAGHFRMEYIKPFGIVVALDHVAITEHINSAQRAKMRVAPSL